MPKPSLIIIDDEFKITKVLENVCSRLGYDVETVTETKCFIETISSYVDADAIILDIMMPDCDGIEILQILATNRCGSRVILISGKHPQYLSMARKLAIVKGLNIVGTLRKPFKLGELRSVLRPTHQPAEQIGTGRAHATPDKALSF